MDTLRQTALVLTSAWLLWLQRLVDSVMVVACPPNFICECVEREGHTLSYLSIEIDCSGRNLSRVPDWSLFGDMPITWVDLSRNNIRELPDAAFAGLQFAPGIMGKWIPRLDIDNNPIHTMSATAFRGLRTPELYLHIQRTHMTSFPVETFQNLANLTDLFFTQSQMLDLPNGCFQGMRRLRRLDLSGNRLGSLRSDVFAGLEQSVKSLYLENMGLVEFPSKALKKLRRLFELKLSYNHIRALPANIFHEWATTTERFILNMQHNALTDISPRAFYRSPLRLEKVFLQHNNISDTSFLQNPCSLTFMAYGHIDLHHNPIVCRCKLYSVLKAGFYDLHGKCVSPIQFINVPWISKDYDTLGSRLCRSAEITRWNLACMSGDTSSAPSSRGIQPAHTLSLTLIAGLTFWALIV